MRIDDETVYTVSIPNDASVNLSENNPAGLFTGDTNTYRFAGIIYGKEDDQGNITSYYTDVNSVSFKPLDNSEYLGVYMNGDPSKLMEENYRIYYVYYPMPKIVYMQEGANGALTLIDTIERNKASVTLNGGIVTQNAQLEVGTDAFIIDQSSGSAFRVPPDLDGEKELSLNYVKIGTGTGGLTNTSGLDGVSAGQAVQLKVIDGQVKYSFDGITWSAFSGNEPTVYVIYKEKGYDLKITKTVEGAAKDGEFDLTITSPAITESSYSISGYVVEEEGEAVTVETIPATPANGEAPGSISLKVRDGSEITISALQHGSYTIAEPGLTGFEMTATIAGYAATISDNATTFVLNADTTADITNKPSTLPVRILKVDDKDAELEGAAFTLVDSEGNSIEVAVDGNSTVFDGNLTIGKVYTLTETEAPENYEKLSEAVTISVAQGGITVSGGNEAVSVKEPAQEQAPFIISVENRPLAEIMVQKVWACGDFVTTHGSIHVALYKKSDDNTLELVEGSVKEIAGPDTSVVYKVREAELADYTVREVTIDGQNTLPVVASGTIVVADETTAIGTGMSDTYVVTYSEGQIEGDALKKRTDTVTNTMRKLTVNKTDLNNNPLKNAVFTLTGDDKVTPVTDYESITSSDVASGNLLNDIYLPNGIYYLKETNPPAGYLTLEYMLKIIVDQNSISMQTDTEYAPKNYVDQSASDNLLYTFNVENNPGVVLPSTGGSGTLPYTLGGIALIIASALMYGFRMRRRERRLN